MTRLLVFAFLLLASFPAFAAESGKAFDRVKKAGVLRCGFIPWPPGFEVDPNTNEVRGPTKALFEAIIRLTGWDVEFVQTSLGNVPLDLEAGKFDAMCADGPWTITNVRHVDYTTPVAYSPVLVYVRADEARFGDYAALNDPAVTLVGIDGDLSTDLAHYRFPKAKIRTLVNLTDPAQMMMEVAEGKADAVILDPVTAESFMKNNPGRVKQLETGAPLAVYPVGMSVKWGEYRLKEVLSRATEMAINIGLADDLLDLYDPTRRTLYSPARFYSHSN